MPTPTLTKPSSLSARFRHTLRSLDREESGSATVEYILFSVVLLIPLIYFMIAIHHVQTASYAAAAAADHGAKISGGLGGAEGTARAHASIEQTVSDYAIDRSRVQASMSCVPGGCDAGAKIVTYSVTIDVPVPVFHGLLGQDMKIASVSSQASAPISEVD
ncbi:hypothetical protein [Micrococcoides hystricis]|uniref:Pilus assembly protein n=1 Tax=Micrococcoides hystricis TaxID=1572761 RepID=A0ABV6P8J1_9MICC